MQSYLLIDWGTAYTKATLFEPVAGRLRLTGWGRVATQAGGGLAGLDASLTGAVRRLEAMRQTRLLPQGEASLAGRAEGVELALALLSAAPPLRVALLALTGRFSLESGRRALAGSHVQLVAAEALDQAPGLEEAVERALNARPEAVVLVGGMERARPPQGMRALAGLVARAILALPEGERPTLVFAGHPAVAGELRSLFASQADLWVAANVRPRPEQENLDALREVVDETYLRRRRMGAAGALAVLGAQAGREEPGRARRPVLSAAQALSRAVAQAWRRTHQPTAVAWWGAGWAVLAAAGPRGVGMALRPRLTPASADALGELLAWLPSPLPAGEAASSHANARLRPTTVPQTRWEALLEVAEMHHLLALAAAEVLSQACQGTAGAWRVARLILGGGAFGDVGGLPLGPSVLAALDALTPSGLTELFLDPVGVTPAAGALAAFRPDEAEGLLAAEHLVPLGTLLAPGGRARRGQPALALRLGQGPGAEVVAGTLERLPWPDQALVRFRLRRGLELGPSSSARLRGGALGLILDLRGRPLTPEARRGAAGAALQAMGFGWPR